MYVTIRPLKNMPYAQAKVLTCDDGTIILRSYATDVVEITPDGWLTCFGLYSNATRKHISNFMRELPKTPSGMGWGYATAKEMYLTNQKINLYTGEIKDL